MYQHFSNSSMWNIYLNTITIKFFNMFISLNVIHYFSSTSFGLAFAWMLKLCMLYDKKQRENSGHETLTTGR